MRRLGIAAIAAVLTMGAGSVLAQGTGDLDAVSKKLAAGEWILGVTSSYMGVTKCTQGETYVFSLRPQTVKVRRCVLGVWQTKTAPWTLRAKPPTDVEVVIGGEPAVVKFRVQGLRQEMLLRRRVGEGKAAETVDQIFRLSED